MYNKKDKFLIRGGKKLHGELTIQTSKNATLPIISACLLIDDGEVKICNCPNITDFNNMLKIMKELNVKVKKHDRDFFLNAANATNTKIDCKLSSSMRSSLFLLGSTLARFKKTVLSLPGGCKIGARPIDIHINSLKKLGVKIKEFAGQLFFDASSARAGRVKLKIPSVGATENLIQFACKLKGKTTIYNCAREPEVVDLCNFLNQCGAKILGAGTSKITICGKNSLYATIYTPQSDRIVAGTIMIAVAICGGEVVLKNCRADNNSQLIKMLSLMGCKIKNKLNTITISQQNNLNALGEISTGFYPAFPTDLQSQISVLSLFLNGKTTIKENIFENRFLIVDELRKLGAEITQKSNKEIEIVGNQQLHGGEVDAQDLRGGASLVLAGLKAKTATIVNNAYFVDRGYEHIETMLSNLGTDIKRIN